MHHTVTAISGGTSVLLIGGRASPTQPNDSVFHMQITDEPPSKAVWSKIELHPNSSLMEPRWRHTADCIKLDDGGYVHTCILGQYMLNYIWIVLGNVL